MAASDAGASLGTPDAENCSDIRLLLSALVDGEATPAEAVRAKNHILICPNCASHLAFLRLTGRALSQVPEAFPPPSLSARIAAATYERPTLAERIAGWLRPAPVRVALGTAMAAGLALVLIVPRMGGEIATSTPSVPSSGGANPVSPPTKLPAKNIAPKSAAKASASLGVTKHAVVPDPEILPEIVLPSAAQTAVASAPAASPAPASHKSVAPIKVARAELNTSTFVPSARTDAPMDRHSSLRSSANLRLKTPGSGGVLIPRSGYDRAAVTEPFLKPRDVASAAPALPTASGVTPSLSPLLSENATVKLAEPGSASAERIASRTSPAATVASAAEVETASSGKMMRFHLNSKKNIAVESFSTAGLNRGSGGFPSAFGRDSASGGKAAIVDLPMTGTN